MPTYDYRCLDCDHEFQIVESLSEHEADPRASRGCPECGSDHVERVLTGAFVNTEDKT